MPLEALAVGVLGVFVALPPSILAVWKFVHRSGIPEADFG